MKKAEGLVGLLGFAEGEEERICPEHGRYISHLTYLKGELKNASGCPKCRAIQLQKRQEDEERERKEREELEKRRSYEQTLDRTAIPTKYRSRTLASFRTDGNDQKAKVLKIAESYITSVPVSPVAEMSIGSSFTAPAAHMASKAVLGSSLGSSSKALFNFALRELLSITQDKFSVQTIVQGTFEELPLVTGICLNLRGLVDGRVGEHSLNHLTGDLKRRSHERK